MGWWLVLLWLLVPGVSAAATYYVSQQQGSDSAPCTQAQPCRTINGGIARLASGDTLLVQPGVYDETLTDYAGVGGYTVRPPAGRSWTQPTTIRAEVPGTVTVQVSTPPGDWQSILAFETNTTDYVVIQGFVLNGRVGRPPIGAPDAPGIVYGIGSGGSSHIRYQDLLIDYPAQQGVSGDITNKEFLNVSIRHVARDPVTGADVCTACGTYPCPPSVCHGYYTAGSNALIDGGTFADISAYGLQFYTHNSIIRNLTLTQLGAGGIWLLGTGNTAYNNVVQDSRWGILAAAGGNLIAHNTIASMREGGMLTVGGNVVQNNLLLQLPTALDVASSAVAGNLAASLAAVVNAAAGDFHLSGGSPARAAGTPLQQALLQVDKDGVARPSTGAPDVGAYQYCPGCPPGRGPVVSRLPAPTNLRVRRLP